jgi:predicted lactoylglutathione lyase
VEDWFAFHLYFFLSLWRNSWAYSRKTFSLSTIMKMSRHGVAMKTKNFWLNLPVRDVKKSKEFFEAIGFKVNPMHENAEHLASFLIGENNFVLMLFPNDTFRNFTKNEVADTEKGTEVLLNIDAQSKEEVDEMAKTVRKAGGRIFAEPGESEGWMYAFGFEDLDGHRWVMLHMDMSKMPIAQK